MKVSKLIQTQGEIIEIPKWGPSMAVGDSQKFKRGHKGLERTLHRKQVQPSVQDLRVELYFLRKSSRETNVDLSPLKTQKLDTQQSEIWKIRLGIETFSNSESHDLAHELCYQNRDTAQR